MLPWQQRTCKPEEKKKLRGCRSFFPTRVATVRHAGFTTPTKFDDRWPDASLVHISSGVQVAWVTLFVFVRISGLPVGFSEIGVTPRPISILSPVQV